MTVNPIIPERRRDPLDSGALGALTPDDMRAIFFGDSFSSACDQFARPGQVAPDLPVADACMRCGRRESMHAAEAHKRLDRLSTLGQEQMATGLAWLAGYRPAVFDAVLDAAEPCDEDDDLTGANEPEPYCILCGDRIGIFLGYGDDWRHYRGDGVISKAELFDAGHAAVVGWRPAGDCPMRR